MAAPTRREAFAIVRIEEIQNESIPIEMRVTVKLLVWSLDYARREVERLNRLNGHKGCHYFWQTTRVLHE